MHCSHCGNIQVAGKFCSACGNKLVEPLLDGQSVLANEATVMRREVEPSVHMQNMKRRFRVYHRYFMKQFRQPSLAHDRGEAELSNGLISILLFTALFTMSLFLFTKSLNVYDSLSFLSFFIGIFLLGLVLIGIPVLSIFIINYVFGPQHTFKEVVGFYGGQLPPLIIGAAVSFVLMLGNLYMYGNALLSVCLIFAIFVFPPYMIIFFIAKKSTEMEPLYGLMVYILFFTVVYSLFRIVIADSPIIAYFQPLHFFL